ncbi:ABC-2 type transporter [Intrasporangium calvum DSM 43043]|uniref:Transport permease protein n=2 Tax=Intrasporangium calvum TaxID=53358 RepID=E6SFX9_INTC7|nr:ABC-2 type transporter [Intrasporangium calvum DSM 43043]
MCARSVGRHTSTDRDPDDHHHACAAGPRAVQRPGHRGRAPRQTVRVDRDGQLGRYREWMLPRIMAQTMAFSCFIVAIGLTNDINKGIMDRFRSLPISRASVLIGRSISSLIHSSIGVVVMAVTGLVIGWRIRSGLGDAVLGFALLLLFGFAMIWFGILAGSALKTAEAVQGVMFTAIFPLTFLANTFAPTERMVPFLRTVAEWNPISSLVQAMRELWGNAPPPPPEAALPLHHPIVSTILWAIALTLVLAPLSIRAFNRRATD